MRRFTWTFSICLFVVIAFFGLIAPVYSADMEQYLVGFKRSGAKITQDMEVNIAHLASTWPIDAKISILGCTDKSGHGDFNRRLAGLRAQAVVEYLHKLRPSLDIHVLEWDETRNFRGVIFLLQTDQAKSQPFITGSLIEVSPVQETEIVPNHQTAEEMMTREELAKSNPETQVQEIISRTKETQSSSEFVGGSVNHSLASVLNIISGLRDWLAQYFRVLIIIVLLCALVIIVFCLLGALARALGDWMKVRKNQSDTKLESGSLSIATSDQTMTTLVESLRDLDDVTPSDTSVATSFVEKTTSTKGAQPYCSPEGIEKLMREAMQSQVQFGKGVMNKYIDEKIVVAAEWADKLIRYEVNLQKEIGENGRYINPINNQPEEEFEIRLSIRQRLEKFLRGERERFVEAMLNSGIAVPLT